MRIGIGFDAHRFVKGRPLILGGVEIPFHLGLEGHSDADVIIHAIIDAILGAISAGDIGKHFPDTDEEYKDISSLILLSRVANILSNSKFQVGNIDAVTLLEEPKISPYRDEMRGKIAKILRIEKDKVSIKASTTEGLGFTGRAEGIAAYAVVLVEKVDERQKQSRVNRPTA
jgi:2-C-methyl-D-erythritol 2,4-cyclodiphosphate synthase